ncbi:filamentous hemagglutinin N-terminal domain-containing protein [Tateyamaria armeniaca]|uniref:Filamentous hemagglutinin N-terminal domain-containing protein n=1 Tax=Tateyamaria armeniaca TaxID=2518930 RepID=A0ABW8UVP8_9RHOB
MVIHPIAVSAQSITIDGSAPAAQRPGLSTSGGKPLINIAPPTNGVSVNRYSSFSTNSGAIFNNSTSAGASRTGGSVGANTRLGSGAEARVILNDVRGTQRSNLGGDFEIFGKKADLVITNQNGITCNGCSFINSSRTTLGTGAASVNANGDVILDVKKGNVHIGRDGATADGHLNLVGRTVTVDGPVQATVVDAIGGASTYNARNRAVGANTGSGAAGSLYAVDATQFGAMTAGQIRIIGNENGLGVRTQGKLTSTSTDVSLHSKAGINHASVQAKRDFVVRGANGFVQQDKGVVTADRNIDIRAMTYAQAGTARMEATGNINIDAGDAILIAGEVMSATATYDAVNKVINVGEIIASGDVEIVAGEVWNMRSDRRIDEFFAEGGVADGCFIYCFDFGYFQVTGSANWTDRAYMVGHGGVVAAKNLSITASGTDISNSGVLVAAQSLLLDAKRTVTQQSLKGIYRTANSGAYLKTDITKAKSNAVANKIAAMTGGTVRDIYNGVRDPLISGSRVFYGAKAHGIGSLTVKAGNHVQNLGGEFKSNGRVLLETTNYDVNLRAHGRWSHNFSYGNNFDVIAGRNINLTKAHFIANAGTLKIDARDGIAADQESIDAATYRNLFIREMGDSFNNTFTINTPGWVNIASRGTLTGSRSITAASIYMRSTHGEVNQNYATRTTGQSKFVSSGNMRIANSESSGDKLILESTAGNIYIQGNARGTAIDIDAEHSVINGTSTMYAGGGGINIWAGSSITNEGGRIWSHGNIDLLAGRKRGGNITSSHTTAAALSGYIRSYGTTKNVRLDTDRGTIRLTNNGVIASGNVTLDASGELWIQRSHVEGNIVALEARTNYIVNELGSLVKANLYDVNTRGGKHLYNRTGARIWAKRDVKVTANAMYNHGQPVTAGRDIRLTLANRLENYNSGANRAVLNAARHLVITSAKGDVYNRTSDMTAGGNISIDAGADRVQFWDSAKLTTGGALDITAGESGSNYDGIHITGVPLNATSITMNTAGRVVLYPGSDITTTAGDLNITAGRRFYQLDSDLTSAAQMFVTSNGATITGARSQSVNYMKYDSAGSVEIYDGYGRNPVLKSTTGSVDVISSASHIDTRRATIDAKRFIYLSARNNLALQTNTTVNARTLDATLKAGVGGHIYYRYGANVSSGRDVRMDSRNNIYIHGRTLSAARDIISNSRAQVEVYNDGASRARLQAGRNITVNSTQGRILTRTSDWAANTGNISTNAGTHSVEFWGGATVATAGAFSAQSGNWSGRGVNLSGMPITATSIHLGSGTGYVLLEPGSDLTATSGTITIDSAGRYYQRDSDVTAPGDITITSNGAEIDGSLLRSNNGAVSLTSGSNVRLYDAYTRNPVIWAKGAITIASTNSHFENRGNINAGGAVSVTSRNNLHNEYDGLMVSRTGSVSVRSTHGSVYNRYNGTLDGKTGVSARAASHIYNHGGTMKARTTDLTVIAGGAVENHKWSTTRGRLEAGRHINAQAGTSHFWHHNSDMVAGGNMRVGSTNTHLLAQVGATFTQGGTFTAFSGNYAGYGVRLLGTPITATAISLSSTSGYIQVEPAALTATAGDITIDAAGRFYQRDSALTASGAISITANGYENDGSWTTANGGGITVASGGSVDITDAYGRDPRLWATGAISITSANSHFVNNGVINGGGAVSVTSRTNLHNDHGALIRSRTGNVSVRTTHGTIYNRYIAALHAKKSVTARADRGHIHNHGGTMHAIDTDLTLTASHSIENHKWSTTRGRLEAGRNVSAQAGVSHLWSVASDWIAGNNMRVGSTDRQVEVTTGSTFTQGGNFTAFSSNYDSRGIRLYGAPITAKSISLSSTTGYVLLEPAALTATAGNITIDAAKRFYQRDSHLTASGAISITSNGVDIKGSDLSASGGDITIASLGSVDIHDAYSHNPWLWASGAISVSSQNSHLVNNGAISAGGNVTLTSRTNLHNDTNALIRSRNGTVALQSTHGSIYNRYSSKVESKGATTFDAINIYNDGASVTAGGRITMTASNHLRVIDSGAVRSKLVSGTDPNLSTSGFGGSLRKALQLNSGTSSVWVRRSDLTASTTLSMTSANSSIHNEYAVLNATRSAYLRSKGEFRATGGSLVASGVTIDSDHHLYLLTGHRLTARNGAHDVTLDAFYDYLVRDSFVMAGRDVTLSDSRHIYIYDSDTHAKTGKVDYVARGEIKHRIEDTDDSHTTAGTDVRMVAGGLLQNYRAEIVAGNDVHLESTGSYVSNNAADVRAGRDLTLLAKRNLHLQDGTSARDGALVSGSNMTLTAGDTLYGDAGFITAGHWVKFKSRLTPRFYAQVYQNLDALHFGVNVSQGSFTSDFNINSTGAIDIYARDGVTLKQGMRGDNWVRVKSGPTGKITAGFMLRSDTKWLEVKGGGDITLGNVHAAGNATIESTAGSVINTYNMSSGANLIVRAHKDIVARHSVATRRGAFRGAGAVNMNAGRNMAITNALVSSNGQIDMYAAQKEFGTLSVTTTLANFKAGVENRTTDAKAITMVANYGGNINLVGAEIYGRGLVNTFAGAGGRSVHDLCREHRRHTGQDPAARTGRAPALRGPYVGGH